MGPFTYDPTTPRGQVRLLITDTDPAHAIFGDADVDAFLSLQGQNVKRAAAAALDVIASSQALVLKVVSINGMSANGASVANALRAHASALREQSYVEETDGAFDWAEQVENEFGERERLWKQYQRGALP